MMVLDCTIRDGGYYNSWNFDIEFVNQYLKGVKQSGVQAIEIGFKTPLDKDVGIFAKLTDDLISKLYKPKIEYYGVMINNTEFSTKDVLKLFRPIFYSPINFVRVATYFKDIEKAKNNCEALKNLGYIVTCNLMQAADKSYDEIKDASVYIDSWETVDVLYLADSLGSMNSDDIDYSFKAIKEGWKGLTGFHGHNNKNQALSNSIEAVDIDVDWVDGTMLGMGRGPGNTELEYLLFELNKKGFEFDIGAIFNTASSFLDLKNKYNWGSNIFYYLSAEFNIHPTYIQKLLSKKIEPKKILKIINKLKNENYFKKEIFDKCITQ